MCIMLLKVLDLVFQFGHTTKLRSLFLCNVSLKEQEIPFKTPFLHQGLHPKICENRPHLKTKLDHKMELKTQEPNSPQ